MEENEEAEGVPTGKEKKQKGKKVRFSLD